MEKNPSSRQRADQHVGLIGHGPRAVALAAALACAGWAAAARAQADASLAQTIRSVQPKVVKIFGSGGLSGLEAYQSGFLISPDGHVATVWSYVLDSEEYLRVVLNDGSRHPAKIVNHDPRLEIAVLKIDAHDLPCFKLEEAVEGVPGDRVLAFSNLFGVATGSEAASVQRGVISAVSPLAARRGVFDTSYRGSVYVVDAMTNNPGSAGGALTDHQGRLLGLLGKELRNSLNNTWLNYAIPVSEMQSSVNDILAGRIPPRRDDAEAKKPAEAHTLAELGITLAVPDLLARTPPFVEQVRPGSPVQQAGLQPDDLILFVNDRIVSSSQELMDELSCIDRIDGVRLTIDRHHELLEIAVKPIR